MKEIKYLIYLFFLLSCTDQPLKAQKANQVKKIAYVLSKSNANNVAQIDFKDSTGQVMTSFDLDANNPFNQFDLPDKGYNSYGGKVYPLKEIPAARYQSLFGLSSNARSKNIAFAAAESEVVVYKKASNYALVAYNLFLHDGYGETFEARSRVIVLNQQGKTIQQFDLPHIARVPLITDDAKYFFADYGGAYNCTEFEYTPQGFKVYNVQSGKLIYEESRDGKESLHPIILKGGEIDYSYRIEGGISIKYMILKLNVFMKGNLIKVNLDTVLMLREG